MGKVQATTPAVSEFLKWLETSPHLQHLSWYSRFRAVVELWFAGITRNEPDYLARVEELGKDAVRGGAVEHFSKLWMTMLDKPQDLLGEAYQAYACGDKRNLAQYFTPDSVAQCMAQVTVSDMDEAVFRQDGGCRILEPACGSGVMMIHALCEVQRKHGDWALARTQAVLVDLDLLCVKMAGLQLWWLPFRVGSVVLTHGDSLAQTQKTIATFGVGLAPTYERIICKTDAPVPVVRGVEPEAYAIGVQREKEG